MPWRRGRSQKELWEKAKEIKTLLKEEIKDWLGVEEYELRSLYFQLRSIFEIDYSVLSESSLKQIDEELEFSKTYWRLSYLELQLLYDALRLIHQPFYGEEKLRYAEEILSFLKKR